MKTPSEITDAIRQVCPIDGVSFGDISNKATWQVAYSAHATEAQRTAAQNGIAEIDLNALTEQQARQITIKNDTQLIAMVTQLKTATPAQTKNYVQGLGITDPAAVALFTRILLLISLNANT